ncbi:MAG: phospholipase D family protein [Rhodocyclaceae bacterium]|nr:phospholipase D family protein [Rhodocyclaceae bacterium]
MTQTDFLPGRVGWLLAVLLAVLAPAAAAFEASPPRTLPAQGTVEALFSPWDDVEGALLRTLRAARESIHVQAFSFTSRPLAAALLEARARGVRVAVLADREQTQFMDNSRIPQLAAAGIEVALETRYAAAHNKILLIDAEGAAPVVVTGSYNFTWSAQAKNAENVLFLRGNRALMRRYLENWQRHRAEALPFSEATLLKD